MSSFIPMETDRLILRRIGPDDAKAVFGYRSNPQVSECQVWKPRTVDEVHKFLTELAAVNPDTPGTWLQLAIVTREDGRLIGDCGIRFPDDDGYQVELGITLAPVRQGQGLASEALAGVLGYVFGTLRKHRAYASVDPRNESAISLMNRAGFRQEGIFRKSLLIDGEWVDDMIFAMLASEWQERKA